MVMATRVQALVPLAALVLLAGCGSQTGPPQVLHLAGGVGAATDAAAIAPAASGSRSAGGGDYTLAGTLPTDKPADSAAYTLTKGAPDASKKDALAKALHTTNLQVSTKAGQSWYWSPCGPDTAVSSDGASSSSGVASACAVGTAVAPAPDDAPQSVPGSSGSGTSSSSSGSGSAPPPVDPGVPVPAYSPPPTPPDVPEATVRKAVDPVFTALGVSLDDVTYETGPYGGSASFDPTVGGLRTVGLTTTVAVDQTGAISYANGWLAEADAADLYPLITAQKAFDALPIAPRMMMCPVGPDGQGCTEPQPQEVTGAHLGLLAEPLQEEGMILVPAWLFDVKGSTYPLTQIAVEGTYLGEPEAPTEPATNATDQPLPPPAQVDPVAPSTVPVHVDAAFKGTKPNQVVVQYGDSSSCPHTGVTHDVKEDATTVYVVLMADAMQSKRVCTDDYLGVKVTIDLQAPLGSRKVVDANTNEAVPVT